MSVLLKDIGFGKKEVVVAMEEEERELEVVEKAAVEVESL
jgi:hypothetical protein